MATFNSFEEIKVWQKSHEVSLEIYRLSNDSKLKNDFGLKDQMRRSSVSVSSNIAEGHDRGSTKQFIYFLNVSRGSCAELRSQLILAKDLEYISNETFASINIKLIETGKMLGSLIKYLKNHTQN